MPRVCWWPLAAGRAWVPRRTAPCLLSVPAAAAAWRPRARAARPRPSPLPAPPPQRGVAARPRLSLGGASSEAEPHRRGAGRTPLQTCDRLYPDHPRRAGPGPSSDLTTVRVAGFPFSLCGLLVSSKAAAAQTSRAWLQPQGVRPAQGLGGRWEKGLLCACAPAWWGSSLWGSSLWGSCPMGVGVAREEEHREGGQETRGPDPRPPCASGELRRSRGWNVSPWWVPSTPGNAAGPSVSRESCIRMCHS